MKIEQRIEKVRVNRRRTIGEALLEFYGKSITKSIRDLIQKRWLDGLSPGQRELAEVLRQPLWREYEGESIYARNLALASIEKGVARRVFYQELAEGNYHPASISEGMSYLQALRNERRVEVDTVLHLGAFILGTEFYHDDPRGKSMPFVEKRLVTKKNGTAELISLYHSTPIKPIYRIVVVEKEKTART